MAVTTDRENDTLVPVAEPLAGQNETKAAPPGANAETTTEEADQERHETFLDHLRRALSALHV